MALYLDSFTDANGTQIHNHTANTGNSYSTNSGHKIQNNRLYVDDSTVRVTEVLGNTLSDSYTIDLDYYKLSDAGTLGICFGNAQVVGNDIYNGYLLRIGFSGNIELYSIFNGGAFILDSHVLSLSNNTALDTIQLQATAGDIKVFYDGILVIDYTTDGVDAGGSLWIRAFGAASSTTGHHLDNIRYEDGIPATAPPIISNQSVTGITATNATVNFDTDFAGGEAFVKFDSFETDVGFVSIKSEGQKSAVVSVAGTQNVNYIDVDGLKDGRNYFAHIVHENDFDFSNVLDTSIFKIPTLNNNYNQGSYPITGTATSPDNFTDTDTATLTVSTVIVKAAYHRRQFNRG